MREAKAQDGGATADFNTAGSRLLRPEEAAERLGVAPRTLSTWRHRRVPSPPWVRVVGAVRYPSDQLEAWIAARPLRGGAR